MSRQMVNDNVTETKDCGLYANMLICVDLTLLYTLGWGDPNARALKSNP